MAWVQENGVRAGKKINEEEEVVEEWQSKRKNKGGRKEAESSKRGEKNGQKRGEFLEYFCINYQCTNIYIYTYIKQTKVIFTLGKNLP